VLKRDWDRMARRAEMAGESLVSLLAEKLSGLEVDRKAILQALEETGLAGRKPTSWRDEDLEGFAGKVRRLSKPLLIVANKVDLEAAEENLERLKETGYPVVPCCAEAELALRRAGEKGLIKYRPGAGEFEVLKPETLTAEQLQALKLIREKVLAKYGSTGVQEAVNLMVFQLLNRIAVFPVEDVEKLTDHQGRVLPDCYLVPQGTTAKQLAALIHSELAEGFIYAVEARSKRRLGEDYVLQHRDVIKIVSSKARA
ncbi:MAG: redox-regulated ATPase YchF, partial [Candidatus Hecatellales archaeon]